MTEVTVVGGGIAGLVASIACAESGASVRLLEAHSALGGRARSTDAPFVANFGPHVLYANGRLWAFLQERDLLPPVNRPPLSGIRFLAGGRLRRVPPLTVVAALPRLRGEAPVDADFHGWVAERAGTRAAELYARSAGVFTFDHDPGRLSAAFVWERWRQAFLNVLPQARYVRGGWSALVAALEAGARERGVRIELGAEVTEPPSAPAIVATELPAARALLGDETVRWPGARTVTLDVGLRSRRGDPFVVWDLDDAGWAERFSAADRSLAPAGHDLVQAHLGLRPGESADDGERRLERVLDAGFRGWRERTTFRRRMVLDERTGALDLPGTSWRDRPAIDRGGGVFLAGDATAAPGLLSDPAVTSGLAAARGALAFVAQAGRLAESSRL